MANAERCRKRLKAAEDLVADKPEKPQPASSVVNPYDVPQQPCQGIRTLEWQQIEVYMEEQHLYEPVEDAASYQLESGTPTTATTPTCSRPSSATTAMARSRESQAERALREADAVADMDDDDHDA